MCKLNITETSQKHHRYYLMPVSYTIVTLVESFLHFLTVKPLNDHKFKGKFLTSSCYRLPRLFLKVLFSNFPNETDLEVLTFS